MATMYNGTPRDPTWHFHAPRPHVAMLLHFGPHVVITAQLGPHVGFLGIHDLIKGRWAH